jgi:hypothetical protein
MNTALPLGLLIESRMSELNLSRASFVTRLGYKNIAKGIRRLEALCRGDIEGTKQLLERLPQALVISAEAVELAVEKSLREIASAQRQERELREETWRASFRPHAVIATERTIPSPIFVAALIGVEKLLRIDFDLTQGPETFVRQALNKLPEAVISFGKVRGFVVNYSTGEATKFDRAGEPIETMDRPIRLGSAALHFG